MVCPVWVVLVRSLCALSGVLPRLREPVRRRPTLEAVTLRIWWLDEAAKKAREAGEAVPHVTPSRRDSILQIHRRRQDGSLDADQQEQASLKPQLPHVFKPFDPSNTAWPSLASGQAKASLRRVPSQAQAVCLVGSLGVGKML